MYSLGIFQRIIVLISNIYIQMTVASEVFHSAVFQGFNFPARRGRYGIILCSTGRGALWALPAL